MKFGDGPIWQQMIELAEREEIGREDGKRESGLLPNWGVTDGDDLMPVERYTYLYPFGKDVVQYESFIEEVYHSKRSG